MTSEFPVAKDDDDDDVAWALSTAQVQWKRGSQADAVVWLRRAIDSAVSVGATWRAAELTRETDELEALLLRGPALPAAPPPASIPDQVAIDEFDGAEMIDSEATSLPPDASLDESFPPLGADPTDERTALTPEEDSNPTESSLATADEVEAAEEIEAESDVEAAEGFPFAAVGAVATDVEDDEVVEIDDDDIAEDDIADDELGDDEAQRFPSEAPTANFVLPSSVADAEAPLDTDADAAPDTEEEPEPIADTDDEPVPDTEQEPEPLPAVGAEPERASEPLAELKSEPEPQPEPELPPPSVQTEPFVAGISLAEISGFEDFPPETQLALAKQARVERLATEEEVSAFGLALVLRGAVNVMPTIADVACGKAGERELVFGRGTLTEGVALRLVATAPDTQIALWDFDVIEPPLADCPWVLEELQGVADRYQALAGVAMGPMGERLDEALRNMVLSRCKLVKLLPGEVLVEKGKPVKGLFIVGAGRLELGDGGVAESELSPGDFLFAPQILGGGAAPTAARAGAAGALLMAADRHDAHELMLSVPPLLELLAG